MTYANGVTPSSLEDDNALIDAIGQMGLQLDQMTLSVDRKIDTLLQETRQWEERQQIAIEQWGSITQQLTELLSAKTKETEGIAASYATLAEHLMKFAVHLSASEGIMHAVEAQLKRSSPTDSSSASTLEAAQANQAQLKQLLDELSTHLRLTPSSPPKNLSIWTEVFAWRPAVAWFSIGGVGVAAFLLLTLRMSGFDLAVRSLLSVDGRLQRIEQLVGLEEMPHEIPNPEFEAKPIPDE